MKLIVITIWILASVVGFSPSANAQTLNPSNGHHYEFRAFTGGSWTQARSAAESLTFAGKQGHLATVTSQQETDFIAAQIPLAIANNAWLGGFQNPAAPDYAEPAGGWQWVTGETWSYTNWAGPEPNNFGGEDKLHIYGTLYGNFWNDIVDNSGIPQGYVVEYDDLLSSSAVPEPGSMVLLLAGCVIPSSGAMLRRLRSKKGKIA